MCVPRAEWMGKTKQSRKSSTKETLAMVLKELSLAWIVFMFIIRWAERREISSSTQAECINSKWHQWDRGWDLAVEGDATQKATRAVWGSDVWNVNLFIRCTPPQIPSSVFPLSHTLFSFPSCPPYTFALSTHTVCFFSEVKCSHLLDMFKTLVHLTLKKSVLHLVCPSSCQLLSLGSECQSSGGKEVLAWSSQGPLQRYGSSHMGIYSCCSRDLLSEPTLLTTAVSCLSHVPGSWPSRSSQVQDILRCLCFDHAHNNLRTETSMLITLLGLN